MSELEVATSLLLIESDAEEPAWVTSAQIECLEQNVDEPLTAFIERSGKYIVDRPALNTVVVALSMNSTGTFDLDARVRICGAGLLPCLQRRTKVRLLFSAPPHTIEAQRRRLLGLITNLTAAEKGHYSCIIGAHFSASPPSSSRIALQPNA